MSKRLIEDTSPLISGRSFKLRQTCVLNCPLWVPASSVANPDELGRRSVLPGETNQDPTAIPMKTMTLAQISRPLSLPSLLLMEFGGGVGEGLGDGEKSRDGFANWQ